MNTTQSAFAISALGDEIAPDIHDQLRVLNELNISGLDVRAAWDKNVAAFTDDEARQIKNACDGAGVAVMCVASPVGKSPIEAPLDAEEKTLARCFQIADVLGTKNVRIFSFYPPAGSDAAHIESLIPQSIERLQKLAALAEREGFHLYLENERDLIGDLPARCAAIMNGVLSTHLHFLWDPANFVLSGATRPMDGWQPLADVTEYVHIKDARAADGTMQAAGEGDGQFPELIAALMKQNYRGVMALEPHLAAARHSSGFSGPEGMKRAADALRRVLSEACATEIQARKLNAPS